MPVFLPWKNVKMREIGGLNPLFYKRNCMKNSTIWQDIFIKHKISFNPAGKLRNQQRRKGVPGIAYIKYLHGRPVLQLYCAN
jgi:hypothetical protein